MSQLICQNFDAPNPNVEIRLEKKAYDSAKTGMVGIPDINDKSDQEIVTNCSFFS